MSRWAYWLTEFGRCKDRCKSSIRRNFRWTRFCLKDDLLIMPFSGTMTVGSECGASIPAYRGYLSLSFFSLQVIGLSQLIFPGFHLVSCSSSTNRTHPSSLLCPFRLLHISDHLSSWSRDISHIGPDTDLCDSGSQGSKIFGGSFPITCPY